MPKNNEDGKFNDREEVHFVFDDEILTRQNRKIRQKSKRKTIKTKNGKMSNTTVKKNCVLHLMIILIHQIMTPRKKRNLKIPVT